MQDWYRPSYVDGNPAFRSLFAKAGGKRYKIMKTKIGIFCMVSNDAG